MLQCYLLNHANILDMVVNESIPMVEIKVAELKRLKWETESYWAELNKWNEEICKLIVT